MGAVEGEEGWVGGFGGEREIGLILIEGAQMGGPENNPLAGGLTWERVYLVAHRVEGGVHGGHSYHCMGPSLKGSEDMILKGL